MILSVSDPFSTTYQKLCQSLMRSPEVTVRGLKTRESLAVTFQIDPMWPEADRPGFSREFALTETLQVVSGRGDLGQLAKIAPRFRSMAPSYVTYGPRISWQLKQVYEKLSSDYTSRQALVQVHTPDDLFKSYPETPCTLSLQFLARDGRLHQIATMRSNDIWFGTPTDVWMFTFFQRHMARALRMESGIYQHQAGSLHVYEEHYDHVSGVGNDLGLMPEVDDINWTELVDAAHLWLDFRRGDRLDPGSLQGYLWEAYLEADGRKTTR